MLLLAMVSMVVPSCAASGVRPTDSEGELHGEGVGQVAKKSSSKGESLKGKMDPLDEDSDIEDEFLDGMDDVDKCLDITLGDVKRAWDPTYMGGKGKAKPMSKKKAAKRCVSI
jgi:hypothetical protein